MTYRLSMMTELSTLPSVHNFEAADDESAVLQAEEYSERIPCLICMTLHDAYDQLVKGWPE